MTLVKFQRFNTHDKDPAGEEFWQRASDVHKLLPNNDSRGPSTHVLLGEPPEDEVALAGTDRWVSIYGEMDEVARIINAALTGKELP